MVNVTRRRFLGLTATGPLVAALGCRGTTPTIFGYQLGADALYDPNIKTVYVPVFNNRAFQYTPYRGFEADVTQAVVREIGKTTTFKVVSDPSRADTELLGNIAEIQKQILNRTQQNTVRDGDLIVSVDVVWRDLRTGEILSSPRRGRSPVGPIPGFGALPGEQPPIPFDPSIPLPPEACPPQPVIPQRIVAMGRYVPELGETNASASKQIHDKIAVQIVGMMERKW